MPRILVVTYCLLIVVCLFLQSCLKRIPPEYRQLAPRKVWLLLIPCFNTLWIFFVCIKLARSFKSHFDAKRAMQAGDCGYSLSLAHCITTCVVIVLVCVLPILGFTPIAADVLQAADQHQMGKAGPWFATFVLMIVNVISPIPVAQFVSLSWAPSSGFLLLPVAISVLLVIRLVDFIKLRNRIGKPA